MHRFFVEAGQIQAGVVRFEEAISRQISRVLRLTSGSTVIVLDNSGIEHAAVLDQVDSKECTAIIEESHPCLSEAKIELDMQLCLSQREKFEWMLQKCTEIGVSSFTPVISSRTMIQQPGEVSEKYTRWEKIIREAAEQSGRGRIPHLNPPIQLIELIAQKGLVGIRLLAWEGERQQNLKRILQGCSSKAIAVLIGPEGGFSTEEANQAIDGGYQAVTLGRRILRMETAAIVTAALILYELDEE